MKEVKVLAAAAAALPAAEAELAALALLTERAMRLLQGGGQGWQERATARPL